MRTRLLLAALTAIVAGCSPSGPSGQTQTQIQTRSVASVSIAGPSTIAPGATAAFSATAHLSDGSTQDFTAMATWRTDNSRILTISSTGQATAGISGDAQVTAVVPPKTATVSVTVIPPGTFRLTGTVTESKLPVSNATVAVTSGIGTGLSTTTNGDGQYRIYGVAGNIEITVSKDGYTPTVQTVVVTTSSVVDVSVSQSSAVRD